MLVCSAVFKTVVASLGVGWVRFLHIPANYLNLMRRIEGLFSAFLRRLALNPDTGLVAGSLTHYLANSAISRTYIA